jgi:hypothetical protein
MAAFTVFFDDLLSVGKISVSDRLGASSAIHPWRSHINTDFMVHLFLASLWIVYREENKMKGTVIGLVQFFLANFFFIPYILLAYFQAQGNVQLFLLGCNYRNRSV